jgi:hypothetical protein
MLITVRIFGIGPDVFLDERRKRLRQSLVTVNSGIDKQIDGPGVSPRVVKTGFGGRDREVQNNATSSGIWPRASPRRLTEST